MKKEKIVTSFKHVVASTAFTINSIMMQTVYAEPNANGLMVEGITILAKLIIALAAFLFIGGLINYAESRQDGGDGPGQNKAIGKMSAAAMILILAIYLLGGGAKTIVGFIS